MQYLISRRMFDLPFLLETIPMTYCLKLFHWTAQRVWGDLSSPYMTRLSLVIDVFREGHYNLKSKEGVGMPYQCIHGRFVTSSSLRPRAMASEWLASSDI